MTKRSDAAKRPVVCVHVRTGWGETSTPEAFLDAALLPVFRVLLERRREQPAIYVASDVPWKKLLKIKSKTLDKLRAFCVHRRFVTEKAACAHVGDADDPYFSKDLRRWRKEAGLPTPADADLERAVLDVATCALADQFVHSPARVSSFSVLVNDLRRKTGTAACDDVWDWAPGPTRHRYPDVYGEVS